MIDRRVPNWAAVGVGVVGIGIGVAIGWGVFSSAKATPPSALTTDLDDSEVRTARIQIGNLDTAVKTYRTTHRSFPDTLEEVSRYLEGGKVPLDPWDSPYLYMKKSDGSGFEIHSKGPDKADGTADDVFWEGRKTIQRESTAPSNVGQGVLERCAQSAMGDMQWALLFHSAKHKAYPAGLDEIKQDLATGRVPVDPWGRAYAYSTSENQQTYVLVSAGPDGKFRTPDDLRIASSRPPGEGSSGSRDPSIEGPGIKLKVRGQKNSGGSCLVFLEIVQAKAGLSYVKVFGLDENKSVVGTATGFLRDGYGAGTLLEATFHNTSCSKINSLQFEPT